MSTARLHTLAMGLVMVGPAGCVGAAPPAPSPQSGTSTGAGPSTGLDATDQAPSDTDSTPTDLTGSTGETQDGSSGQDGPNVCGDGNLGPGEACDDGNDDPSDGCLSTCVVPRSCAEVLALVPGVADGTYVIAPDGEPLATWCDMTTDGGGWMLVAKVNPADQDAPARSEPLAWLNMELHSELLATPDLLVNGPLASHDATRFETLVGEGALARFELVAADDFATRVAWYKEVAPPSGMSTWFDVENVPSQVCTDARMTMDCEMGHISPVQSDTNAPTVLSGMQLEDFGYPGTFPIHMRLDNDPQGPNFTGISSSTDDNDGNAWPDSYALHWGNALLIWVRESPSSRDVPFALRRP